MMSLDATCPLIPAIPTAPGGSAEGAADALRFNGRKRAHDADETMARITAERLVEHLERSGYVVMHKPPLGQHGAPGNLAAWIEKATKLDRGAQLGVLSFPECPSNKPAAIAL